MANEFIPVNLSELENFAPVNLKQIGIRDYSDIKRQEVALAAAQKKQQLDPNRLPDTIEEYKLLFPTATPEQLQNYVYTKQEQAKQRQIDEVHQQGVFKNTSAMDYPVSFASGVIETASVIPLLGDMALRAATAGNYSLDELLEDTTGLPQNSSIKKDLQSALHDQLSEKAQLEDQEKQLKNELFNIRKDQRLQMSADEGYGDLHANAAEFMAEVKDSLINIGEAGPESVAREVAKNLPNLLSAQLTAMKGAALTKTAVEKAVTHKLAAKYGDEAAEKIKKGTERFMASKAGIGKVQTGATAGAIASMMAMEGSSNAQEAGQQIREMPSTELRATKGYQEMQKANPKMSEDDIRLALANKAEEVTLVAAGTSAAIPATLMGGFLGRTAAAPISKATIGSAVKATLEGGVRETLEETGQGFSGGVSKNFAEEKVLNREDFSEMSAKELLAGVGRETAESAVAGFGAGATFAGTAHGGKYLANKAGQAKDKIDDFQEQRTANKILTENSPAQKARMMEQEYTKSHKGNKDNVEAQVKSRQEFVDKIQPVMDQFDTELATREQALQTAQETQKQWEDKLATLNKDKNPDEFREASRAIKRGRNAIREATEALEYTTATQNRTRKLYEGIQAAEIEDNTGLDVNTNPEQVILADNATPAMKKLAIQKILGIKTFGTHGTDEQRKAETDVLNKALENPAFANDEETKQRISTKLKIIQYYEAIQNGAAPDMTDANQDTVAQDILVGNERNKFLGVNEYILDIRGAIASKNKQVGNKLMRGLVNLRMSRDIKVDLASKIHAIAQNSPDDATFKQNAGELIKEYQARFPRANGQLFNIHRNTFNTLLPKMQTEREQIIKAENELQQEAKAVFKMPLAAQAYSGTQRRFTPSEDTAETKQAQAEAQQAPVNQEEEIPVDESYAPADESEQAPEAVVEEKPASDSKAMQFLKARFDLYPDKEKFIAKVKEAAERQQTWTAEQKAAFIKIAEEMVDQDRQKKTAEETVTEIEKFTDAELDEKSNSVLADNPTWSMSDFIKHMFNTYGTPAGEEEAFGIHATLVGIYDDFHKPDQGVFDQSGQEQEEVPPNVTYSDPVIVRGNEIVIASGTITLDIVNAPENENKIYVISDDSTQENKNLLANSKYNNVVLSPVEVANSELNSFAGEFLTRLATFANSINAKVKTLQTKGVKAQIVFPVQGLKFGTDGTTKSAPTIRLVNTKLLKNFGYQNIGANSRVVPVFRDNNTVVDYMNNPVFTKFSAWVGNMAQESEETRNNITKIMGYFKKNIYIVDSFSNAMYMFLQVLPETSVERDFLKSIISNKQFKSIKFVRDPESTETDDNVAVYDPTTHTIRLSQKFIDILDAPISDAQKYALLYSILLHEGIHGITLDALTTNTQFRTEIEVIWRELNQFKFIKGTNSGIPYGLTDSSELLAEAFSNKEFQNWLHTLKVSDGLKQELGLTGKISSFWDALLQSIYKLFNKTPNTENISYLGALMEISTRHGVIDEATAEAKQEDVIQQPDETPVQEQTEEVTEQKDYNPMINMIDRSLVEELDWETPVDKSLLLMRNLPKGRVFKELLEKIDYAISKVFPNVKVNWNPSEKFKSTAISKSIKIYKSDEIAKAMKLFEYLQSSKLDRDNVRKILGMQERMTPAKRHSIKGLNRMSMLEAIARASYGKPGIIDIRTFERAVKNGKLTEEAKSWMKAGRSILVGYSIFYDSEDPKNEFFHMPTNLFGGTDGEALKSLLLDYLTEDEIGASNKEMQDIIIHALNNRKDKSTWRYPHNSAYADAVADLEQAEKDFTVYEDDSEQTVLDKEEGMRQAEAAFKKATQSKLSEKGKENLRLSRLVNTFTVAQADGKSTYDVNSRPLQEIAKEYGYLDEKDMLTSLMGVLELTKAQRTPIVARDILISSLNEKLHTLPTEFAYHYLLMFYDSPIVQKALVEYGGNANNQESMLKAAKTLATIIGKQTVAQKGKALNTWKGVVTWILDLLNRKEITQILTDSFIKNKNLNRRFEYKDSTEVTKPELVKYLSQSSLKNLWMEFPKVFPNLPKMSSELISTIGKNIPARLVTPTVFETTHAGPLHKTVNGTVVINVDAINNVEDMNRIGVLVAKALLTNAMTTVDVATLESVRKALTPYFDKYATTVKGTNPKQDLVTLFLKTMFDEDTRYLANIAHNSEVEELVDTLLTERIPKTHGFLNRLKKKKSDYNYLMASAMSLIPLGKGVKVKPDSIKFGLGNALRSLMKTFSPKGELANTDSLRVSEIEIADLAQDQQEFLTGVQSFTKRFGDTFIEYIKPLSTGKNLIKNAVNYQPTSLFVDESGQFHPWFAEAVGLAAYEWLAISGPSTLENTLGDIRINLGKSKDAYLTPQEMAEQRFIGSQAEQVSERIGLRVLRNLGITFNTDTAAYQYHKDMARHIGEAALIVLSKTPINEQSTQPAVTIDKTKAKNIYGEDGRTVVRVEGVTMRFVRANSLGAEAEGTPDAELDKLNKDIHTHMDLFESLTEQEMELTARSKPVKPYTEIDLGFRKASKKAVATINALNNSPYYIQQEMFKLYSVINESDVNDMIGIDNRPESKIHVDKREGVGSRNLGIQRVRDKLAAQIESMRTNDKRWADGTDSPIYLNHTISSNDRFFVDSPLNPQTSKLIRQMLTKKERMSTIDLSSNDNNDLNLFKFAVLEAFGEKVNKLTPTRVREKFDELLGSPDTQEAIQEVRKALEDGATNVAAPTLARLSKSKENLWTTSAVLALSKYQTAVQSGATSFETDLYIQFDGTTNGYFFSIFLMALGKQRKGDRYETDNEAIHRIKEMAQKVGVFTKDSPYKTVNDYKQVPGNEDIYEERAKMFIDAIREMYADKPGVAEAIEQLFSPFDKPWMDASGTTSSGRNLVKNAVTQLIYGAGPGGIALSIKEDAIDTLLDKFEQIALGGVDVSKKQEILEQLRVLAKLAPEVNSESLLTELAKANGDALLEMSLIPYERLFATIFNHMRVDKETTPNVGGAVEQLIERQNPVMKENKDWMVQAVKRVFTNFAEKMQESINAVALDENGKIDPSRITEDRLMEIYNQHAAIAPIFHTANSEDVSEGYSLVEFNKLNPTGDSVNEETGSVFEPNRGWKLLISFSKNETRVVLHDGKTFDEGETGKGNKITPTDEWTHGLKPIVIKLPSVSIAPGLTISSDAATISTPLTEKAIVGVHDGVIMGINQASETGNLINDSAIEVITNYSSLESVLNRFKEIYSAEINTFYNDSEVKKDMEKGYLSVSKALRERHPIGVQYHLGKQKVDMLKRLKDVFVPAIQYSSQYNPHIESGSHINESATDLPTAIPVSTGSKTKMNPDAIAAALAELAARDADKNASLKPIPVSEEERKKTEEFWISWGVLSKEEGDLYDVIKAILKKTIQERTKEDDVVLYDSKNARVLAIVRSEMGSSQEGVDESLFTNSVEQTIDHNNAIDVFDGLANEGNVVETTTHSNYLRSLISQIYLGSMGVLQMATETFGDTTKAVINLADKKIRMQLASKATMNTMMMGGIRMSAQQAYTHELTHNHMAHAIDNDTAVARQARLLFKKAEENVTWEDFITPGVTPTAEEIIMAKNTYDYIFRNEASIKESSMYLYQLSQNERNAYLHEFAAFGLTNENFIRKLKTIKLTRKDLVSDKVGASNKNVFTVLAEMITEHFNRLRLKLKGESLDATTDVHAELYRLARELSETNEKHGFKVFEKIKEANEFTAKYTKAMAAAVWENDSKTVTAMKRGLEEYLLKTDEIEEFYRVTMNEITGSKPAHQVYEWIARINSKNLEQKPIHQSKHIAEVIEKQFAEGVLTEQTRRAIHRALVVTDLSSLMVTGKDVMDKHFTWTKIKEILTDIKALDSEIAAIEAEIRKVANAHESNFIEAQVQSLGAFLATGMTTEQYTLRSLESIVSAHPALLETASRLVSLQTLKYTDQQSKEILAGMIDTSQEALEFTINTHAALKAVALKRAPDNSKFRLKGALQDTLNHYKDVQVFSTATETPVKIQEKINRLTKLNYVKIREDKISFTNHKGESEVTTVQVYGSPFNPRSTFDTGAVAYRNPDKTNKDYVGSVNIRQEINAQRANGKKNSVPKHHTIVDNRGNIATAHLMYSVGEETLRTNLDKQENFSRTLGQFGAVVSSEITTVKANRFLSKEWAKEIKENMAKESGKYLVIPVGEDATPSTIPLYKKVQKEYMLLPPHLKAAMLEDGIVDDNGNLTIHREAIKLLFAQSRLSPLNLEYKQKDIDEDRATEYMGKLVNNALYHLLYNKPGMYAFRGWEETVSFAKGTIVIKGMEVLIHNIISNNISLVLLDVGFKDLMKWQHEGYYYAKEYQFLKKQVTQMELEMKIDTKKNTKEARIQLSRLKNRIASNPTRELFELGAFSAISEEIYTLNEDSPFKGLMEEQIEKITEHNPLNEKMTKAFKIATLQRGTIGYQAMMDLTQMSDFVARYVLWKQLTERKGMKKERAIQEVMDTFVMYDTVTNKWIQLGNDVGLIMFTKFWLRTQRVIKKVAVENPVYLALYLFSQYMFFDTTDILDSFLFNMPEVNTPWGVVSAVVTEQPLVKLLF